MENLRVRTLRQPASLDLEGLTAALGRVFAGRPEVLDAYVFGSVARGEATPGSDLDLAVTVEVSAYRDESPFGLRACLSADVQRALCRDDIDLVLFHQATLLLQSRILRDGVRIFSRDLQAATAREAAVLSRWCDWKPVQDRIDALLLVPR